MNTSILHLRSSAFACLVAGLAQLSAFSPQTATAQTLGDPAITTQPYSVSTNSGATVVFRVGAVGTPPLAFQWWKNGARIEGETNTWLTLAGVQGADAGSYRAEVANDHGSTNSATVTLTVFVTECLAGNDCFCISPSL